MNKIKLLILSAILVIMPSLAFSVVQDLGPNLENKAIKKIAPAYPPLAKRKRIEGKVTVKIQTDAAGNVSSVEFFDGNSLFKPVSLDAAKQWVFQRTVNGMNGYIIFKFELADE